MADASVLSIGNSSQYDLGAFIASIDRLNDSIEQRSKEQTKLEASLESSARAQAREEALISALKGLFGLTSMEIVQGVESDGIIIKIEVGSCNCNLYLDKFNRLSDLKMENVDTNYIDKNEILQRSQLLSPPNDIRQAIFFIKATQSMRDHLKRHITEQRKKYIIAMTNSHTLNLQNQHGISVKLRVHSCYPTIPAGIWIEDASNGENDNGKLANHLRSACNTRGYCTLSQICNGIETSLLELGLA